MTGFAAGTSSVAWQSKSGRFFSSSWNPFTFSHSLGAVISTAHNKNKPFWISTGSAASTFSFLCRASCAKSFMLPLCVTISPPSPSSSCPNITAVSTYSSEPFCSTQRTGTGACSSPSGGSAQRKRHVSSLSAVRVPLSTICSNLSNNRFHECWNLSNLSFSNRPLSSILFTLIFHCLSLLSPEGPIPYRQDVSVRWNGSLPG